MPFPEGDPADGNARKPGHLGLPGLGLDVSIIDAVIMEVLMMFVLVLVIFGTAVEPVVQAIAPLAIGLIITMDILGRRVTGAAMNPASASWPALVQQDVTNWWIYWIGPIIAGVLPHLQDVLAQWPSGPSTRPALSSSEA